MTWGPTTTGFNRPTFDELLKEMKEAVRGSAHSRLTLDPKDPLGSMLLSLTERIADAYEHTEAAYNAIDPDNADDFAAENQAALLGIPRRAATKGTVSATVNVAAGTYDTTAFVAHVIGEPDNRWVGTVSSLVSAGGDETVTFEAETAGAFEALAGTLTVIADGGVTGWNSITNAADADAGLPIETIEELLLRKDRKLAQLGNSGVAAVKAAIEDLEGVISCKVHENDTDAVDANGLPPHSIQAVVHDNAGDTADNLIAQAILDNKTEGITADGAQSGTAIDVNGDARAVSFERATVTPLHVAITVEAPDGVDTTAVKSALVAVPSNATGAEIVLNKFLTAAMAVAGVTDVQVLKVDTVDPPVNVANFSAATDEAFDLDSADIDVTVVAS